MNNQHVGRNSGERNRGEIFEWFIRNLWVEARINDITRRHYGHRVPVRRRTRRTTDAEIAAGAGLVFDIKLLPQTLGELLANKASDHIRRSCRSIRHNDFNRASWI